MKVKLVKVIEEIEVGVEANVFSSRPAPLCFNPDKSAFYDPGDPGEVELSVIFTKDQKEKAKKLGVTPQVVENVLGLYGYDLNDDEDLCNEAVQKAAEKEEDLKSEREEMKWQELRDEGKI